MKSVLNALRGEIQKTAITFREELFCFEFVVANSIPPVIICPTAVVINVTSRWCRSVVTTLPLFLPRKAWPSRQLPG